MKLKYAPFKNKEEEEQDKKLKAACEKHQKEFFSNINNIGRPYFPLLIITRILVEDKD